MPPREFVALQTGERVFLRMPEASDQDEFLALRRESHEFHRQWEPRPAPGVDPFGEESFARYLRGRHQENLERTLLCRREDGAILGAINLSEIVRGPFQSAYLGYWIGADHARSGYMTEGLELMLRHSFLSLELHRIEANIRPENTPSLKLVKRVGFQKEGYSPRYLNIDGAWRDHERWTRLCDEWATDRGEVVRWGR